MHRYTLALVLLLTAGLLTFAPPVAGEELTVLLEEVRTSILERIDDFAVGSCDPPCPGLICCDNSVCVHSVFACGLYPIHIDSFRIHGSPHAQMAGFTTQGVLAAEFGQEARLWFGKLDGEVWYRRGVRPGLYELVLLEGATLDHAVVAVVDSDGQQVARIKDRFWVFSTALDTASEPDWNLTADALRFEACDEGRCVQLNLPLSLDD